jgi:hypothetical protein
MKYYLIPEKKLAIPVCNKSKAAKELPLSESIEDLPVVTEKGLFRFPEYVVLSTTFASVTITVRKNKLDLLSPLAVEVRSIAKCLK